MVMNCYHHATGDCTSGMLIVGGIMEQYDALWSGNDVLLHPHTPKPCVEDLTNIPDSSGVLKSLVDAKVTLGRHPSTVLPFDQPEPSLAGHGETITIFTEGMPENYECIRKRCHAEMVTVGSLALACTYLSQAVMHAELLGQDADVYQGMAEQAVDVPVNVRRHVDPAFGDEYCGLYITEVTTNLSVDTSTKLWPLARLIGQRMKDMIDRKHHLLFSQAKEMFETGEESHLAAHATPEVIVSNLRFYPFNLNFEWGNIRSVHSTATTYSGPGFPHYLLLLQSTNILTYNMVHWPGKTNSVHAEKLLNILSGIMESSGETSGDYSLLDILKKYKRQDEVALMSKPIAFF